jgi:ribosomal protein S18 acetylase RimI-like enzyme
LRKITMTKYLEESWIFLTDNEHLDRVISDFENAFIIFLSNEKVWLIKYVILENYIEIIQFQILPEFQGKWIWTEVLNILSWISNDLNKKLFLKVLKSNPVINLYEKFWFKLVGEDEIEFFMEIMKNDYN